jgi:hypothetical protein
MYTYIMMETKEKAHVSMGADEGGGREGGARERERENERYTVSLSN